MNNLEYSECKSINEIIALKHVSLAKRYLKDVNKWIIPEEYDGIVNSIRSLFKSMKYIYTSMLNSESFTETAQGLLFIGIYYGQIRELYLRLKTNIES